MNIELLIKAIITGVITSMPSGPITLYALHKLMDKGRKSGIASGMGIASADAIFALIAAIGVFQIDTFLTNNEFSVRIISAVILTLLGLRILFKKSDGKIKQPRKLHHEYRNTFFLAIINPPTIFVFLQIFILFHININPAQKGVDLITIVSGILIGAFIWWLSLAYLVGHFKRFVSPKVQLAIRKASGIIMIIMAISALLGLL
ncbi:MAG: hypothetical protein B6226_04745 [Candidatus Cloacimonetes bacterium 4572_65]|nr:MAG: hypothetical protein B6226_04745 [Candidatus Cloacimonetes bacterium 4572_65]